MMTDDEMASRVAGLKELVQDLGSSLKSFQNSQSRFARLRTLYPSTHIPNGSTNAYTENEGPPKTLFILDSSFNPPSIAHRYLSMCALQKSSSDSFPKPHRLLLLFATMNADKAPSSAPFDQRLKLMYIFAHDLLNTLKSKSDDYSVPPIDIGLTTVPYYTDKTAAIEAEGTKWYPDKPKHIHLVGYDTLTRLFNAKYYKDFDPPFSALEPYFNAGHRFQVTLRPDDEYGTTDEQKAFLKRIEDGELEKDGAKREWAKQIALISPHAEGGVSSTKIRNAANRRDWDELSRLTTPTVAEWVKEERLYEEESKGAKMA